MQLCGWHLGLEFFCYYCINTIHRNLGQEKSRCLSPLHSFTGCDTTSSFIGKTKKSARYTWNAYADVNSAFLHMAENSYNEVSPTAQSFPFLERFTILLYDMNSILKSVNEAKLDLFCKKNKSLESLPPIYLGCTASTCTASLLSEQYMDCQSPANPESTHTRGMGWIHDADSG